MKRAAPPVITRAELAVAIPAERLKALGLNTAPRRRRECKDEEHETQAAFVAWVDDPATRVQFPALAAGFAVPNFSGRLGRKPPPAAIRQAQRANREGRRKGVPDWWLPVARRHYIGMVLEFKSSTGRLDDDQQDWRAILEEAGHFYSVVRTVEEAKSLTTYYLSLPKDPRRL